MVNCRRRCRPFLILTVHVRLCLSVLRIVNIMLAYGLVPRAQQVRLRVICDTSVAEQLIMVFFPGSPGSASVSVD